MKGPTRGLAQRSGKNVALKKRAKRSRGMQKAARQKPARADWRRGPA